MDEIQLAAIAGLIISLAFSLIPGLKTWYDAKAPTDKQAIMGGVLVVVAAAIFGISCTSFGASIGLGGVECSIKGAWGFLQILIAALVANQGTYLITRKPSK